MATSVGTVHFVGASGQGYVKDIYVVDTANALDRWDGGAGADSTSPDYWETPEPLTLTHYYQVAATGQTRSRININGTPTQSMLRNALHIPSATIIGTPYVGLKFPAKVRVSITAIA